MVNENIKEHTQIFLNGDGQEVYPPWHHQKGQIKPDGISASYVPKSLAEDRPVIDEEAQKAIDLLKEKGLL